MSEVRPGQIWKDNDKRHDNRQIIVEKVCDGFAFCSVVGTKRTTRISLQRFKPNATGYVLVKDVAADCEGDRTAAEYETYKDEPDSDWQEYQDGEYDPVTDTVSPRYNPR